MENELPKLKKNQEHISIKRFKETEFDIFDKKLAEKQFDEFLNQGGNKNVASKR